ncbi:hypothetical protein [Streptomyces sp. NPDC093269]|uniref:hypothetical protein n=1 Tax=Streptomyces sp. NPDC093269 TaxID=3366038 RepID=UPI003823117B
MSSDPTPAVWIDGDPLMEAIAEAAWNRCERGGNSTVFDDPRNIAAAVANAARAIVLREAAEAVAELREMTDINIAEYQRYDFRQRIALTNAADKLSRMATKAQRAANASCPRCKGTGNDPEHTVSENYGDIVRELPTPCSACQLTPHAR